MAVHPRYRDLTRPPGVEIADIVYRDRSSVLTELLIEKGYLEDVWTGARPRYLIEVKTTTGECNDRLFMSNSQYLRVCFILSNVLELRTLLTFIDGRLGTLSRKDCSGDICHLQSV